MKRAMVLLIGGMLLAAACAKGPGVSAGPTKQPSAQPPAPTPSSRTPSPSPTGDPAIVVQRPAAGETVSSPVTIAGTANVFEAVVSFRLIGGDGVELAAGTAMAACGTGCRGDYEGSLKYVVSGDRSATLEVFEASAKDGSPINAVRVPVMLTGSSFSPDQGGILVSSPAGGATVSSPITVGGRANVFEANVSLRLLDQDGNELATTFATASCGTGCWGDFSATLTYSVDHQQHGTIEVFQASAEDGSALDMVRIPVTLESG
jgi:immunoglobulin-like protein involved in spore germination